MYIAMVIGLMLIFPIGSIALESFTHDHGETSFRIGHDLGYLCGSNPVDHLLRNEAKLSPANPTDEGAH
jgi:hypothetical protein